MAKPSEPNKIIYSMVGVGKVHGTKQVLKDISLSYFYGAKIGVLGLNGAGKSTLLRIMAGVETEFLGETHCSPGYTIGLPGAGADSWTRPRPSSEVVREGVQETVDLLKEFEEISGKFAEPMSDDEMNALLEKQGKVQDKLDTCRCVGSRQPAGSRHGRAALPAGRHAGAGALGRRAAPRGALPSPAPEA